MAWLPMLNADPLPWLLEPDPANPGVRFFALRDLLGRPEGGPEVVSARADVMRNGPVPAILAHQEPEGYWVKAGHGYSPKYTGTVWQVIFLAQLGADGADARVRRAGDYVLDHSRSARGGFTCNGTAGGMVHCLEGNLCAALVDLGFWGEPRLGEALDWLARSITGEGIAPAGEGNGGSKNEARYLLSGNCGPGFACSANNRLPCAWGAVKAMLALGKVLPEGRTPAMRAAIDAGIEFLLSRDPAVADYPTWDGRAPSGSWFKPGYPIGYVADVLQNLEALASLGMAGDPRLEPALHWLLGLQDAQGRWRMDYTYNGKTWVDVEEKRKPSKWVTLRALRVLRAADAA